MNIDRRYLLGSLAAAAVCVPAADSAARSLTVPRVDRPYERWFLARESRQQTKAPIVDFWQRPFCDIAYTQYLHEDIARNAIWWDSRESPNHPTVEMMERSFREQDFDWAGKPHRLAAAPNGDEELSSALRSLIDGNADGMLPPTGRTALIALDSLGPLPEPNWADVIPAFRACYDRVIGHFHLPQRGLRQYRQWLNSHFGEDHFQQDFVRTAALCDAVVLTSSTLVETDFGLSADEGGEALVGEQMRRFGCALLDRAVAEHIAGATPTQLSHTPRVYVLTSVTCEYADEPYAHLYDDCHIENVLFRQRQLIAGNFDETSRRKTASLIVTGAANLRRGQIEGHGLEGQTFRLRPSTRGPMSLDARDRPTKYWLQMITLWPIEMNL